MIENKSLGIFLLLEGIFAHEVVMREECYIGGYKDIYEATILQGTILSLQPLLVRWQLQN